jgi:hypothetical protein
VEAERVLLQQLTECENLGRQRDARAAGAAAALLAGVRSIDGRPLDKNFVYLVSTLMFEL